MEFIERLSKYLALNGVTYTMHANIMRDDPDDAISVRDTGGYKPEIGSSTKYPTVQIIARSKKYSDAKQQSMKIYELLHDKEFYKLDNDTVIVASEATQEPAFLSEDGNGRSLVVCNYNFTIRR